MKRGTRDALVQSYGRGPICRRSFEILSATLVSQEQRIPPSRGLIVTHDHRGRPYAQIDLKRWIRYSRLAHRCGKFDVLDRSEGFATIGTLFDGARELQAVLSLRTDCAAPPPSLGLLKDQGLHDVFLCPGTVDSAHLDAWLSACKENQIAARLQVQAPFDKALDAESEAARFAGAGVVAVNITLWDPFLERPPCGNAAESRNTLDAMQRLATALEANHVEANILHVPLCVVGEEHLRHTANSPQCALDHQQYERLSYDLASRVYRRGPLYMKRIMLILLAEKTLSVHYIDNYLLPWMLHRRYAHFAAALWRRLTWPFNFLRNVPAETTQQRFEQEQEKAYKRTTNRLTAACAQCRLRRICDHETKAFTRMLPGLHVEAQTGDVIASPLHFSVAQPKYYDSIDARRRGQDKQRETLAKEAKELMACRPPDRILGSESYAVEDAFSQPMEGGIRWHSMTNSEKRSSVLARLEPPFSLAVDFGQGIAEYVGFCFGRRAKLVCPMETYRHTVTLHVDAEGAYVLLRDGEAVRPVEFTGHCYVPPRLGGVLEPRISIWNIEDAIMTHNIRIWEGTPPPSHDPAQVKYSIIIVSTRFTRRLQGVLRSLLHQENFDLHKFEVIIAYVPGIDATDDLIDSAIAACPEIRFIRSPFPEHHVNSKGYLINESRALASGEWIMLLDSDTLLPPDMFARIDALSGEAEFIAPDGRKLLTRETTAKILLGELNPWEHWDELLDGPGEYRHREAHGVPVGFCQCFKAKYLDELPYTEVEHFEGADMAFGMQLRERVGREHRLSGVPVIHLDHGSSQWFGTQKHL